MRTQANITYLTFALISIALLSSCSKNPPEIKTPLDVNATPVTAGSWYKPSTSVTWQWQLQVKSGSSLNTSYNVEIYDIDLFDNSAADIQSLKSSGKKVICYFSSAYENWRPDHGDFPSNALGNNLDSWEGERWVDIRLSAVHNIMLTRLDLAKSKGCDGVEPDNMDAYQNNPGFPLSANDQLAFNRFIANEAHKRELSVGLKNDLDQIPQLVDYYDFSINEQCFEYNECNKLAPFTNANKPVLNAEYKAIWVNDATERTTLCNQSTGLFFSTLILPEDLDDSFRYSCL